ncbi:hypothetical protein EGT74_13275 [Chitinophaga lutea]|uniref:Uncharacterized protein n=1 Tax=Chitinophaga lutea TaxID=2488634 RepID=A0A3N4PN20_9BACT|nr:hypothetical protein [Chitinophaga lutea]RPE08039.1 hypothetical protein EGT74_13275 [Chitinophaga lutea]
MRWLPLTFLLVTCARPARQLPAAEQHHQLMMAVDSLPSHQSGLVKYYLKRYRDTALPGNALSIATLKKCFADAQPLGDLNGNGQPDTVFVLPELSSATDEGYSYYFTDTSLPRLPANTYCCHPSQLFMLDDMDEDGVREVGTYFTSCASRFKTLIVYSLENNDWQEKGRSVFDIFYNHPGSTVFPNYIRKKDKGKFEMLEYTDAGNRHGQPVRRWLAFQF